MRARIITLTLLFNMMLTINALSQKKEQTITFQLISKVAYGDASPYLVATSSSGLPVTLTSDDEDVAFVQRNYLILLGPGKIKVTATQAGDDQFLPAKEVQQEVIVRPFAESKTAGYKNSPSVPSRMHYDWFVMPMEEWIPKYYKQPDLYQWNAWQKHASVALNDPEKFKKEWGEEA
jgi:hypothetical protein